MAKYAPSKNASLIALEYLRHEFRKIFSDVKNAKFFRQLDRSLASLSKREGEASFWHLLAALAEGWKLKAVFTILSDDKYAWRLMNIPLKEIYLTGMSPAIDRYTIKKFNRDAAAFARAWKKDKKMRRDLLAAVLREFKDRDRDPILVYKYGKFYRPFDGMRRVIMALTKNKANIRAWVGVKANAKGRPLISPGRAYFLSNLYQQAKSKDKNLEKAIVRIGKEIKKEYRNGREVLLKRVIGWSHDQKIKELFAEMIK